MALVVFLRGVNVGGHRRFRPSILARELSGYDVLNVGAAGTFVVRKPGSRAKFRTALLRKLPFEAEIMLCDGPRSYTTGDGESVWNSAITPGCCPVREYPVESRGCPGAASSHVSLRRGVVGAGDCVRRAIRVRSVPSSHEDNRLSWPDRQTVRRASYDSELEHNNCDHTNVEESQGRAQGF
jgi:hypothetical protein